MVIFWYTRTMSIQTDKIWPIHEAKAQFTSLIHAAEKQGPQFISRHGTSVAVILSVADFARLQSRSNRSSLVDFLCSAPSLELAPRDLADVTRDIDL